MLSWPQKIPKPSAPSSPSRALIDKYELVMQGFLKGTSGNLISEKSPKFPHLSVGHKPYEFI